jgi:hypothetical protein
MIKLTRNLLTCLLDRGDNIALVQRCETTMSKKLCVCGCETIAPLYRKRDQPYRIGGCNSMPTNVIPIEFYGVIVAPGVRVCCYPMSPMDGAVSKGNGCCHLCLRCL